jgi:hypothetical protein
MRRFVLAAAALGALASRLPGQDTGTGVPLDSLQTQASATLSDSGLVVRFPRAMSPDSITREMTVPDLFSGYEWRVIFLRQDAALLTAFVIPPDDTLAIHHYQTIRQAFDAGGLRRCERNQQVLDCNWLARGLVRDAGGRLEIAIVDPSWLSLAFHFDAPVVRLVVKRARQVLWAEDVPVVIHLP